MSDELDLWIQNVKGVEREYQAARFAVDRCLQQVRQDPTLLTGDLRQGLEVARFLAQFNKARACRRWVFRPGQVLPGNRQRLGQPVQPPALRVISGTGGSAVATTQGPPIPIGMSGVQFTVQFMLAK